MILLWGDPQDRPFSAVLSELRRMGAPLLVLSHEELLDAELGLGNEALQDGELRVGVVRIPVQKISAAYLRPPELVDAGLAAVRLTESLLSWADVTQARIVNRPAASAANNSKPYQCSLIRAAGLLTPESLITTDPDAIREFKRTHGEVVYKSMSGIRSIVSRLGAEQEAYLADVTHCPTMFQEYVAGCDYRVHVVGEQVYASRVDSSADDYRYPCSREEHPVLQTVELEASLTEHIVGMVRRMDLLVAGVDLRLTPDGRWYCFEVNPSPAFSYFSQQTGQPIARAIAQLLAA